MSVAARLEKRGPTARHLWALNPTARLPPVADGIRLIPIRHSDVTLLALEGAGMSVLLGNEGLDAREFERDVVGPAIPPRFAGFEATQQDMLGVFRVVNTSMLVLRLVATPDMAARHTHSEVDPGRSDAKAVFAAR